MATVTNTYANVSASSLSVPGQLAVSNGGTNVASFATNVVVCGGTTSTGGLQTAGAGSAGQAMYSKGAGALPAFAPLPSTTATLGATYSSTTGTPLMVGINATITPAISGKVLVTSNPTISSTNNSSQVILSAYYNTSAFTQGTAPPGGATQIGPLGGITTVNTASTNYTLGNGCALITGLTVGQQYYFDLSVWITGGATVSVVSGASANASNTQISVVELPL
ncbi:MAG: hypothetical protein KGL39_01020 [Patescibacteria group bacterium]|nr:hypothetical protein [Patescibacteria group bacterium]